MDRETMRKQQRMVREAMRQQQQMVRESMREQNRIAREIRQEQERTSREIRQEQERISRDIRQEQERISRDIRQEQQRIARETRQEQQRIARETRQEQQRIARQIRQEQLCIAAETTRQKERIAKYTRIDFHSSDSESDSQSPARFESYRNPQTPGRIGSVFSKFMNASKEIKSSKHVYNSASNHSIILSQHNSCSYHALAYEFISSLDWPSAVFNKQFDRCYCNTCYKSLWDDVVNAGGATYVIPRDWVRLGIHVDPVVEQIHDIWDCWHVTYHGTSIEAAQSILQHRQFSIPGDQLLNGSFLSIRPGHIPGKRHIYTSPTIAYSSLSVYCPSYDFISDEGNQYKVKLVLECRQNPEIMHVQRETVGYGNRRICPHIPNEKIEYFTEARASLVAYGLLLHFAEVNG